MEILIIVNNFRKKTPSQTFGRTLYFFASSPHKLFYINNEGLEGININLFLVQIGTFTTSEKLYINSIDYFERMKSDHCLLEYQVQFKNNSRVSQVHRLKHFPYRNLHQTKVTTLTLKVIIFSNFHQTICLILISFIVATFSIKLKHQKMD